MEKQKIILYSTGSPLIVDFEEICMRNNFKIIAIINNIKDGVSYAISTDKVISLGNLNSIDLSVPFVCTLFTPNNRYLAATEAMEKGFLPYNLLSDSTTDLPFLFKHGHGCFINRGTTIGALSQIGDFVTINRGASLGHHFSAEDFASIGPGVTTGGNVSLKKGAFIGTGAVILPERTIGKNAIVGAGAVVTKDVKDNSIVVGNPAKEIKQNANRFF